MNVQLICILEKRKNEKVLEFEIVIGTEDTGIFNPMDQKSNLPRDLNLIIHSVPVLHFLSHHSSPISFPRNTLSRYSELSLQQHV